MVGAGEATMMAATVLWLLRLAGPERRGRAMGHIGLANYAGLTIGPLLAQALSGDAHPSRVWITAADSAAGRRGAHVGGARAIARLAGSEPDGRARPTRRPTPPEAERFSTLRATLRPGLGLMLVNFGYVAVLSFGAAAATEQGTGIASLVIPVFGIGVIASRTILAGIPDRFGAPRTLSVAVTIESAGLAGMAVTTSTPVALVALVVMAVGQGLAVPSLGMLALHRCRRAGTGGPPARSSRTSTPAWAWVARPSASPRTPRTRPAGCLRRPGAVLADRPSRCRAPAAPPRGARRNAGARQFEPSPARG